MSEKNKTNGKKNFDWSVLLFFIVVIPTFTFLGMWYGVIVSIIGLVILGWDKRHEGPFFTNKNKQN